MYKENTRTILGDECKSLSGWDKAIYDAEARIKATKGRLSELKAALKLFKKKRDSGEPFPGEKSEQTEAGA